MTTRVASLTAVAAVQGGAFTTLQARDAGFTRHAIGALVRAKAWRRLGKGVFVERALWEGMNPHARHLCLLQGRLLVLDDEWLGARMCTAVQGRTGRRWPALSSTSRGSRTSAPRCRLS